MNELLYALIALVSTLLSSSGVYIFMRRKYKAEARMSELDTVDKAISIWRNLAQDLEKKVDDLEQKIREMEEAQMKKCETCRYKKYYLEMKKHPNGT